MIERTVLRSRILATILAVSFVLWVVSVLAASAIIKHAGEEAYSQARAQASDTTPLVTPYPAELLRRYLQQNKNSVLARYARDPTTSLDEIPTDWNAEAKAARLLRIGLGLVGACLAAAIGAREWGGARPAIPVLHAGQIGLVWLASLLALGVGLYFAALVVNDELPESFALSQVMLLATLVLTIPGAACPFAVTWVWFGSRSPAEPTVPPG